MRSAPAPTLTRPALILVLIGIGMTGCSEERSTSVPQGGSRNGGVYFPPAGQELDNQRQRPAGRVGIDRALIDVLDGLIDGRWALWRHGHLVHVNGSFTDRTMVRSVRKTFHAATVGAALHQGRIASLDEPLRRWIPELSGNNAEATWRHVLTQTTAFDEPQLKPGTLWAYSDANAHALCLALARVWGLADYRQDYERVLQKSFMNGMGATGWSTSIGADGMALSLDLEDLGRFGLLMINDGVWRDRRLLAEGFAAAMATKQTYGVIPNFDNANDGPTELRVDDFAESPYGYMTWTNTDADLWPAAAPTWATALGTGPGRPEVTGDYLAWDSESGIVLAIVSARIRQTPEIPRGWPVRLRPVIEAVQAHVRGPNPLVE